MICNKCGKENSNTSRCCTSCGNQLVFEQVNTNYQYNLNVNNNKKTKKWIFIVIGLVIGLPIFIIGAIFTVALIIVLIEGFNDPFDGKWFCSSYNDLNNYSVALDFDSDDYRFTISKYGDEANNYITGEYDYSIVDDKDGEYYELELDADKYIVDGTLQNNTLDEYRVQFSDDEDTSKMILMNSRGYNEYYCVKR